MLPSLRTWTRQFRNSETTFPLGEQIAPYYPLLGNWLMVSRQGEATALHGQGSPSQVQSIAHG